MFSQIYVRGSFGKMITVWLRIIQMVNPSFLQKTQHYCTCIEIVDDLIFTSEL